MDFQSLVERKLEPVGQSGNDIIYRCPQCDDRSGHLYVNYHKNVYNCFKCSFSGRRIEKLLKYLNIDVGYDYSKLDDEIDKKLNDILDMKKQIPILETVDYSTDLEVLTEYYTLHTTTLSLKSISYLYDRGLDKWTISDLGIREGLNRYGEVFKIKGKDYVGRDYSNRILVPSMRKDGLISFYVARDITGEQQPKYLNPPKELAVASEDVWNLDMIDSESVFICEGVFSAIAASPLKLNAVATYGKSIAQRANSDIRVTSQAEKLLNKKFKNYYVVYDADAHDEGIKTCEYLYDRGANVYIVLIDPIKYGPKADVADIGYQEFLTLLQSAIHYDGKLSLM